MEYRIKELLKERGLTLSQLSDKVSMKSANLSTALSEKGNPTIDTLERIASALNVPVTELFDQPATDIINCPKCGAKLKLTEE